MFRVEPQSESVAVLRMDDGKVNAIGPGFLESFEPAWREAAEGGRAVVLAGNAKAYSAGLNLKVLPTLDRDALVAFMGSFTRLLAEVYKHPRPTVAAVDGPALAGGAFFALACDERLATPGARIGLTEMPVGIPFPPPLLSLVRQELPAHEVNPAVLRGVVREGEACVAAGWAHRVVPRERLLEEATAVASEMAAFTPRTYALTKANLRGPMVREVESFEKGGAEAYVDELLHPDTIAGIVSYFERVTAKK